jgi:hypothetical protein
MDALAIHVINGIAATAAYTDDLDNAVILLRCTEVQDINVNIIVCHNSKL